MFCRLLENAAARCHSQLEFVICAILPAVDLAAQMGNDRCVLSVRVEIAALPRIIVQVIEFIRILVAQAKFPAVFGNHCPRRFLDYAFNGTAPTQPGSLFHFRPVWCPLHKYVPAVSTKFTNFPRKGSKKFTQYFSERPEMTTQ